MEDGVKDGTAGPPMVTWSELANRFARRVQEASRLNTRAIVSNPKIMMGKPVVAGTRITVELILENLAAGESIDQIVHEHPRLTREAVQAALAFAAQALRADVVYPALEPVA